MTTAAICPLLSGYLGLVVVNEGQRILLARSLEVGRLVDLPEPIRDHNSGKLLDKRRELTDTELASLCEVVTGLLVEHGTDAVRVEAGKGGLSARVTDALRLGLTDSGIDCRMISGKKVRSLLRIGLAAFAGTVSAGLGGFPEDAGAAAFAAGALWLGEDLPEPDGKPKDWKPVAQLEPSATTEPDERGQPAGGTSTATPVTVQWVPPCVAAIDPGSAANAIVVKDSRGVLVYAETVYVQADLNESEASDAETDRIVFEVDKILTKYGVTRTLIERASHAWGVQSTQLVRSSWLAGALFASIRSRALLGERFACDVRSVKWHEWSGVVSNGSKMEGRRGIVAEKTEARFPELVLNRVNEHCRDAAGILLWDETPATEPLDGTVEETPKAKKSHKKSRKKTKGETVETKPKTSSHPKRAAERKAKREAAGCTCTNSRHDFTCPLFVSKPIKRKYQP